MTNQQPELRPDPFVGPADTSQDPTSDNGNFPFEDFESSKATILPVNDEEGDLSEDL